MDEYKIWEFRKNWANDWPLRGKFMTKIRNFDSFGGSAPPVPNFTFIGATCRRCGAKNTFLDYWVKQYRHGCASRRLDGNNIKITENSTMALVRQISMVVVVVALVRWPWKGWRILVEKFTTSTINVHRNTWQTNNWSNWSPLRHRSQSSVHGSINHVV